MKYVKTANQTTVKLVLIMKARSVGMLTRYGSSHLEIFQTIKTLILEQLPGVLLMQRIRIMQVSELIAVERLLKLPILTVQLFGLPR